MPGQRFSFSAMRRISAAPQSRPSCARRVNIAHSVCQEARRYRLPRRKGNSVRRPIPAANPLSQPRASVRGAVRRRARNAAGGGGGGFGGLGGGGFGGFGGNMGQSIPGYGRPGGGCGRCQSPKVSLACLRKCQSRFGGSMPSTSAETTQPCCSSICNMPGRYSAASLVACCNS